MSKLPPDLQAVIKLFDEQPEEVRELFQYALVMLAYEDGKARLIETQHIDNLEYLTFETLAGEVFEIVKPQISDELLAQLRGLAREILAQDQTNHEDS